MVRVDEVDAISYVKSISDEIDVTKNRVRNLIGSAHWGKEGEFKESILRRILSHHLPNKFEVGTGFILREGKDEEIICSNQIDIIVYDNHRPVLFKEGNFVILNNFIVRGIIEVKTRYNQSNFESEFNYCRKNSYFVPGTGYKGLFYYEFSQTNCKKIKKFIDELPSHWDNQIDICLGKNIFIDRNRGICSIKRKKDLAFAFFLLNALERICGPERQMIDLRKI